MQKKLFIIMFALVWLNAHTQSLNPTSSISSPGSADNFRGGYTFAYVTSGTPWNGSLMSYGGFTNDYDTQISSDYARNRISFRTRNNEYNLWNPWTELASRSSNDFIGNQNISGSLGITSTALTSLLTVGEFHGVKLSVGGAGWANKNILQTSWISGIGDFTELNVVGKIANSAFIRLIENGNVGIGAQNPDSKLTVAGNIHAQEVKVTVNAGVVPDYVFANDYKLKSLNEVEQYIKKNSHLPEIPSAKELEKNGLMIAEMNMNLLKKIEELTLYIIEQDKKTETLKTIISDQNKRLEKLENKQ
ncbi:hypothetical protein JI750_12025 [Flavobacterium sp. GN10]|uniref:Uncharacterized protein n=1 Tax=Flavobacterium tagetis TaxID=2801336 RepID=A0ABS1KE97_9FLAO|nr:tail fiber protein [Flavobacterium tagetis]MBL0737623.1 hypothetical protein [Flavobacterium tagetis]